MKRYISLACIALVIITCMVSPVSAAALDNSEIWVQALDYANFNGESNTFYNDFSDMKIKLRDSREAVYYVELLFLCDGSNLNLSLNHNSNYYPMTVIPCGNNIYRAVLRINGLGMEYLRFSLSGSGVSYFTIFSCRYTIQAIISQDIEGYCQIIAQDIDKTIHYVPTDDINYRIFTATSDYLLAGYQLHLRTDEWKKFDYLDLQLYLNVDSITSISCMMGNLNIPYYVSYIDNDAMTSNNFIVYLRLDLTGLDRTSSDYPLIIIAGNLITEHLNSVMVMNYSGIILSDNIEADLFWFKKISQYLTEGFSNLNVWIVNQSNVLISTLVYYFDRLDTSLMNHANSIINTLVYYFGELDISLDEHFSSVDNWLVAQSNVLIDTIGYYSGLLEAAIRGDTAPGNSFQQQVDQKDQQLNNMAAVMDSVNQPDLNTVNVSANSYVDSTVLAASMSGITSVFSQGLYFDIIVMSIMMATAGYVLFGKR